MRFNLSSLIRLSLVRFEKKLYYSSGGNEFIIYKSHMHTEKVSVIYFNNIRTIFGRVYMFSFRRNKQSRNKRWENSCRELICILIRHQLYHI